jgi:hypothetical protein
MSFAARFDIKVVQGLTYWQYAGVRLVSHAVGDERLLSGKSTIKFQHSESCRWRVPASAPKAVVEI